MAKRYLKTFEEAIDALQAGKKLYSKDGSTRWELYKGVIVSKLLNGDAWVVNSTIVNYYGTYIEEPESLKLEVGKFYKTRRGDKVVCLCQRGDYYIHRLNSYIVGYWVDKTGRALFNGVPEMTETDSDVVALWEDNNAK